MLPFFSNINEQKKQKYFLLVFLVILLITFILLRGYFKKPEIAFSELSTSQYQELKIDFAILENPLFKILRPFEPIPSLYAAPGRENPFLPF